MAMDYTGQLLDQKWDVFCCLPTGGLCRRNSTDARPPTTPMYRPRTDGPVGSVIDALAEASRLLQQPLMTSKYRTRRDVKPSWTDSTVPSAQKAVVSVVDLINEANRRSARSAVDG